MFSLNSHLLDARHNRSKFVCRLHIWHVPHQDCSYPPIMWADILCRNVKTTNACEAFHRHFQSSLQTFHPKRWNKIEQVSNNELKGHYQRGKRYASKEEQRASVAEKYKHGEIDIVGYLFKMSKVMQPARGCRIF